ncbi:MAG: MFS transporter [Candidatus Omnitrophica bacterium]|nr:MFS transporter [Candidatus Omnitrophota bacterium]
MDIKEKMLKPAILSVSLLTIMSSAAVAPALGRIRMAFPGVNDTLIKLVLTLPPLFIVPFSFVTGWLVKRMKKKTIMLIGLAIYFLAGIGGGFARNITELLIIRAILGIGVGLIMPLSTTLVGDFYEADARRKMMGYAVSVQNLGGVIFQIAAGYLAVISWRYSFGVYSMAFVILVLIAIFLPEPPKPALKPGQKAKSALPLKVYICAGLCALNMVVFYAVMTNMAMLLENERQLFVSPKPLFESKQDFQHHLEAKTLSQFTKNAFKEKNIHLSENAFINVIEEGKKWEIVDRKRYLIEKKDNKLVIHAGKLGKTAIAGYILSLLSLSAMISGIFLSHITKFLKRFSFPITILLMGIGFGMLGNATSLFMIFVAVVVVGLNFGVIQPSIFLFVQKYSPPQARAMGMAVVGSSIFFGQFISPIILGGVAAIAGNNSIYFRFNFCAISVIIAGVIGLVMSIPKPKAITQNPGG